MLIVALRLLRGSAETAALAPYLQDHVIAAPVEFDHPLPDLWRGRSVPEYFETHPMPSNEAWDGRRFVWPGGILDVDAAHLAADRLLSTMLARRVALIA